MPTLTIDLPEADYQVAISLSPAELRSALLDGVNNFATAKNKPEEAEEILTPADIAAIKESLEDIAAGRVIDGDEAQRIIRESMGWGPKE